MEGGEDVRFEGREALLEVRGQVTWSAGDEATDVEPEASCLRDEA